MKETFEGPASVFLFRFGVEVASWERRRHDKIKALSNLIDFVPDHPIDQDDEDYLKFKIALAEFRDEWQGCLR